MRLKSGTRWRIDWAGDGEPETGHLVRHVTPAGRASYARVQTVRVVRNRMPLPDGCTCRYAITVQRLDGKPATEPVAWTCHAHSKPKRKPPADVNPWLPPI